MFASGWEALYFGDSDPGRNSIPLLRRMQRSFQILLLSTAYRWPIRILICFRWQPATLPRLSPCSPPKQGKKENGPLAHRHQRDADWWLTISWQLSLLAKEKPPEFTKTKYIPQFWKVRTSQPILSRGVRRRRSLHVWDCSKQEVGSFMAAVSAAS